VSIWWCSSWSDGASASPLDLIEDWLEGNLDWISVILIASAQLVAGSLVYKYYVVHIWKLKSSLLNDEFPIDTECETDLQVSLKGQTTLHIVFRCIITLKVLTLEVN